MTSDELSQYTERDREQLNEYEARGVLREYGVPCPTEVLLEYDAGETGEAYLEAFADAEDAPEFPLYLKVATRAVSSVSDAGGIELVTSPDEFDEAIERVLDNVRSAAPEATIQGVIASEAISGDTRELILGATENPQFGTVISLGIGGIYVEAYNDVAFRTFPLSEADIRSVVPELQGSAILDEFRGMDPLDVEAIVDVALSFATFVEENPEVAEAEINPLLVGPEQAVAADAFVRLSD